MKLIMESWRRYLTEQTAVPPVELLEKYKKAQAKIETFLDTYDDYIWVYYDTETTGLKHGAPTFQVTQHGAFAIDPGNNLSNFKELGKFNPMQVLDTRVTDAIPGQQKEAENLKVLLNVEVGEDGQLKKLPIDRKQTLVVDKEGLVKTSGVGRKLYFNQKLDMIEDILVKYWPEKSPEQEAKKPSMINRLRKHRQDRKFAQYFRNATFMFDKGPKFNIATALEMTRYYGRDGYSTRKQNIIDFSEFLKNLEAKKPIVLIAHNMVYDKKAMLRELEIAEEDKIEDGAYLQAITYLRDVFEDKGYKKTKGLFDTVQLFKQALKPIVAEIVKIKNYAMETDLEGQLAKYMELINDKGNKYVSVSLGPITQGFKIPDEGWHDALADVIMTSKMLTAVIKFIQTGPQQVTDPIQGQLPADYKDCPKGTYPVGDQCVDVDDESLPDFLKRQKAGLTPRPERDPARQRKLPLE